MFAAFAIKALLGMTCHHGLLSPKVGLQAAQVYPGISYSVLLIRTLNAGITVRSGVTDKRHYRAVGPNP